MSSTAKSAGESAAASAPASAPPTPGGGREARIAIGAHEVDCGAAGDGAPRRRLALMTAGTMGTLALCWVLAGLVASSDNTLEENASVDVPVAGAQAGRDALASAAVRRAGSAGSATEKEQPNCRTVQAGEPCHRQVMWAMTEGIKQPSHVEMYPGLTAESTFEEFQDALHTDPWANCPRPCGLLEPKVPKKADEKAAAGEDAVVSTENFGWAPSGRVVAQGQWCSAFEPQPGWGLRGCGNGHGIQVKVLTYNLFWWSLFGRRGGNGGSAGHLIQSASNPPFDVMAFQECEGIGWVLGDAGMTGEYAALTGPHALCIAYRKTTWNLLSDSSQNVAEDRYDQWYGTRAGMWVRLQHWQTGQIVLFINHHGPLPLNSGGLCGGEATAFNLLQLAATQAGEGDVVILVGDFNAGPESQTLQSLRQRMNSLFTGSAFGGVDHVFSSCGNVAGTRNLGSGGSDHDALEAIVQL